MFRSKVPIRPARYADLEERLSNLEDVLTSVARVSVENFAYIDASRIVISMLIAQAAPNWAPSAEQWRELESLAKARAVVEFGPEKSLELLPFLKQLFASAKDAFSKRPKPELTK